MIRTEPRVQLIESPTNAGYFGGAKLGAASASDDAIALIVSNADIVFPASTTLEDIVKTSSEVGDDVGVVAPSIISQKDGRDQNPLLERRPTAREQWVRMRRMSSVARAQFTAIISVAKRFLVPKSDNIGRAPRDIYAPHGSFLIFLRTYFEHGGDLSHPLFLFGEELTVAEQCRSLGLRVIFRPDIRLEHVAHAQIGILRSRRVLREMVTAARYGYELIAR